MVVMPSDGSPTAEPVELPEEGAGVPEGVEQSEEQADEIGMHCLYTCHA